jgi:hypothetical protein
MSPTSIALRGWWTMTIEGSKASAAESAPADKTGLAQLLALANRKLSVSPRVACDLLDIGHTKLYALMRGGQLVSYKDGKSRKILTTSILDYVRRRIAEITPEARSAE